MQTTFTKQVGIEVPLICGAMYPCSNPELVGAVSAAGGIGIIQPIAMIYVHGHGLVEGIARIREITDKPIGLNAIIERSSRVYLDRMRKWIDVALEHGVRFFITALGNPRWVVDRVHAVGGIVYHDVTNLAHARKALDGGVDGLICVNARAGGHAGSQTAEALVEELRELDVPLVCAGGVGSEDAFVDALRMGYAGVQLGTRFIATTECRAHADYKDAILRARAKDIVLTERISGVPVAVIRTPYIDAVGTKAGFVARRLLQHPRFKHWVRSYYSLRSLWELKRANLRGVGYREYFQAGESVEDIDLIEPAGAIVQRFAAASARLIAAE